MEVVFRHLKCVRRITKSWECGGACFLFAYLQSGHCSASQSSERGDTTSQSDMRWWRDRIESHVCSDDHRTFNQWIQKIHPRLAGHLVFSKLQSCSLSRNWRAAANVIMYSARCANILAVVGILQKFASVDGGPGLPSVPFLSLSPSCGMWHFKRQAQAHVPQLNTPSAPGALACFLTLVISTTIVAPASPCPTLPSAGQVPRLRLTASGDIKR